MNLVYHSAFLKALGWSLLDSLWQMGILWLVYVVLTANGKRFVSRQRHALALFSIAGGSVWFLLSLVFHFYEMANAPESVLILTTENMGGTSLFSYIPVLLEPSIPFLSVIYLAFLVFLLIRFYHYYRNTQLLFKGMGVKVNPELRMFTRKMTSMLNINKEISIWISKFVDTPLTIGFWKPVILLPIAAVNYLNINQTEAIILHELYHIKRNDYFVNLLIAFLDIILFFNPFSRIITDIIKKERENSCDDLVLQFRYDVKGYANALLLLEQNRLLKQVFTVAATGNNKQYLLARIKRMLNGDNSSPWMNQRLVASLFAAFLTSFIGWYNPGKVIVRKIEEQKSSIATVANTLYENNILFNNNHSFQRDRKSPLTYQLNSAKATAANVNTVSDTQEGELLPQAAMFEENEQATDAGIATYVQGKPEIRDYSIVESEPLVPAPVYSTHYPFVPSSSFSIQYSEDTSLPKKQIITIGEKKAKEAMQQALRALEEINWQKLEKELGKVDVQKLQREIKKAMEEVDWKKINEDIQSSLMESESYDEVRLQLEKLQESRNSKQEQLKKMKERVIAERILHVIKKVPECTESGKKTKRVIVI